MTDNFQKITEEMHEIHVNKNGDYGSSINDTYKQYGMIAYLVRMEDKLNRARTLVQKQSQNVKDEKLRDTLVDLANYSILAVMELDEFLNDEVEIIEEDNKIMKITKEAFESMSYKIGD